MHIILGFVALLGAAGFWYYRIRQAREVAGEIVDAAQRARGYWRRRKFLSKAEGSVVTAIQDPVVGAAVMMVAIASLKGPIADETAQEIRKQHALISGRDPAEDYTFAKWVVDQAPDPDNISLKLSSLWNAQLHEAEKRELVAITMAIAESGGPALPEQIATIKRLRERLNV